jgi:HEAT repeat protein
MSPIADISIQQVSEALLDIDKPFPPRFLYRLSDLDPADLEKLDSIWLQLPLWRRQGLMEDIEELSSKDTLLDYVTFSRFALKDEDPKVRLLAVTTLWDYEQTDLIQTLLGLFVSDNDADVRAAAAGGLARYVFAGEIEEIPQAKLKKIEEALLAALKNQATPEKVQRAALESLGYSSRDEVPALIKNAFASKDKHWIASALFAMGRSASQDWQPEVLSMLQSNLPLLRMEAARAAGELELSDALPILLEMLDDPDEDARQASIWSLSQIGGEGAQEALEHLFEEAEAEDEAELELLESALDNLTFTQGVKLMPLFELPDEEQAGDEPEDIDEDYLEDLEDGDEEADWYEEDAEPDELEDLYDDEEDFAD